MQLSELENSVLRALEAHTPYRLTNRLPLGDVEGWRECGTRGVMTNINPSEASRCEPNVERDVWSRLSGILPDGTMLGFLVFIEAGHITAIEGYTFGDPWPERIEHISLVADVQNS